MDLNEAEHQDLHATVQGLGVRAAEEAPLPLVRGPTAGDAGRVEGSASAQVVGVHQGTIGNTTQEIGLARLERDQAAEDVEHVHQFRGVVGEPDIGLNPFERGRRTAVADDGSGAIVAPVAESLDEHLLARDFVLPHCRRHIVDEAIADLQASGGSIVLDAVREAFRAGRDRAVL